METSGVNLPGKPRWMALAKINALSTLSQIVQIGTIAPLISLSLEQKGVESAKIGVVVSASWIAILLLYRIVPRLLGRLGLVNATLLSTFLSILALMGMTLASNLIWMFALNFLLGIGLILRWIACDTWIVLLASPGERGRAIGIHETLMGLGIAAGPLLLAVFGVSGAIPYYVCAIVIVISGCIALTLRGWDYRPGMAAKAHHGRLSGVIPIALCGAFVAGFSETSSLSFLASYSLSAGYLLTAATLTVSVFGAGGTVLQLPIGWMADRSSCRTGQLICGLILLLGALTIPFIQPLPWLSTLVVFLWGGAIGGMNTLAVIEAGSRVAEHQVSTAMTAIAMFYTLGSVLGPITSGAAVTYISPHGLVISIGAVGTFFVALLILKRRPALSR